MAPQAVIDLLIKATCHRCGQRFLKNRKDKLYCSTTCQMDSRGRPDYVKESVETNQMLDQLESQPTMRELAKVFEAETGVPFFVNRYRPPMNRYWLELYKSHENKREEQGAMWWNSYADSNVEKDPVEAERRLMARTITEGPPTGETPAEWEARGGIKKVLPPGVAFTL